VSGLIFTRWYDDRCIATVWKRDTYRISRGSGGSGFRMYYTRCQCERRPAKGLTVCMQHVLMHERWGRKTN
jgi:hypothetical protein